MSQNNVTSGDVGTAFKEATDVEAGTGTAGQQFFQDNVRNLAGRVRFLDDADGTNDPGWTAPSLLNSWANAGAGGQNAGYVKDPITGFVYLRGIIAGGTATAGTSLFVLPTGYRPSGNQIFASVSNAVFGCVRIGSDGTVTIEAGTNTYLSLCGILFRTT